MDFSDFLQIAIGKGNPSKPDKNPDPLDYGSIWTSEGSEQALNQTSYTVEQPGIKQCVQSTDCGSNHSCARGICVPNNTVSPTRGTGGSTGNTGCDQEELQPGAKNCKQKECESESNCGDGATLQDPCCGGPKYKCGSEPDAPVQCEPCKPIDFPDPEPEPDGPPTPPDGGDDDDGDGGDDGDGDGGDGGGDGGDGGGGGGGGGSGGGDDTPGPDDPNRPCTSYCDSYFKANGTASGSQGNCSQTHCGFCASCGGEGLCEPITNGPCYCYPGNTGCPDCEVCERGACKNAKGLCSESCSCEVKCCADGKRTYNHSQDYYALGSCKTNCRKAAKKYWCDERKSEVCPEEIDPCAPEDECEKDCQCITQKTSCGGNYTCPKGKKCKLLGSLVASDGNGGCTDGTETGFWGNGGITWFLRVCTPDRDNPECEECDCNCENDCPDCYLCGADGECHYDPECDEVCENEPCDGTCCDAGKNCVPGVIWRVTDPCHDRSFDFVAPQGVKPELVKTDDIKKEEAICDRFHTHCNVVVCGKVVGTHLDCQKGLKRVGASGSKVCGC